MPFLCNPGPSTYFTDPKPDMPIVAIRLPQGAAVSLSSRVDMIPVTSVKRTGDAAADDVRVRAALDAIAAGDFANLPHE